MTPSRSATADAGSTFGNAAHETSGAIRKVEKGRNNEVSALFHVSWQAVAGRLASFSVVPDFVVRSDTPPPE